MAEEKKRLIEEINRNFEDDWQYAQVIYPEENAKKEAFCEEGHMERQKMRETLLWSNADIWKSGVMAADMVSSLMNYASALRNANGESLAKALRALVPAGVEEIPVEVAVLYWEDMAAALETLAMLFRERHKVEDKEHLPWTLPGDEAKLL